MTIFYEANFSNPYDNLNPHTRSFPPTPRPPESPALCQGQWMDRLGPRRPDDAILVRSVHRFGHVLTSILVLFTPGPYLSCNDCRDSFCGAREESHFLDRNTHT